MGGALDVVDAARGESRVTVRACGGDERGCCVSCRPGSKQGLDGDSHAPDDGDASMRVVACATIKISLHSVKSRYTCVVLS